MQNQLPLFLPYDQVQTLPIVKKYENIFAELDLSHIPEFNYGIGANGTSQHALIRAFVIRSLESLKTVPALIRFLQANPGCLGILGDFRQCDAPLFLAHPKSGKGFAFQCLQCGAEPNGVGGDR